jgi:hypothetical protein
LPHRSVWPTVRASLFTTSKSCWDWYLVANKSLAVPFEEVLP